MYNYKVDFESLEWELPMEGIRHKIFSRGNRKLRLVEYDKKMPLHWCERGHIGYVLEGEMEIKFNEQTYLYRKGDGIFIENGAEHRHMGKAVTDTVTIVFVEDI